MKYSYATILKYIGLHFVLLAAVYCVTMFLIGRPVIPPISYLLRYDALRYYTICHEGYTYIANAQSNVAFFPGFPYLWRFTGQGTYGIMLLNLVMFVAGLVLLCKRLAIKPKEMLLFLSLPPVFFIYLPYSEALFFLISSVLLIALYDDNSLLVMISLFSCSLCRSAANIFIPAIIIMEVIASSNPKRVRNILLYSLSSLAGVFVAAWIQFMQTGQWIGFITTQKYWGNILQMPRLPLHSWSWHNIAYLDGCSLLAGLCAIGMSVYYILRYISKGERQDNKPYIFSLLFVSGLTVFSVAFKGGDLFSLNRYILPTAFFALILSKALQRVSLSSKHILIVLFLMNAYWLLFYSFLHIQVFLGYFVLSLYLCLYLVSNKKGWQYNLAFGLLYMINLAVQVHLFYLFSMNMWVG